MQCDAYIFYIIIYTKKLTIKGYIDYLLCIAFVVAFSFVRILHMGIALQLAASTLCVAVENFVCKQNAPAQSYGYRHIV